MPHEIKASLSVQKQRIDAIMYAGVDVHTFSQSHYRLGGPQGNVDYWPSSDKWWNRSTNEKGTGCAEAVKQLEKKRDPRGSGMWYPPLPQRQPRLVDVTKKPPACIDCTASFEFDDGELVCRYNPPTVVPNMDLGLFPSVKPYWFCWQFIRKGTK